MVRASTENGGRENLSLELRRGAIVLAVLAALQTEQYGYSLKKALAEEGLEIDEGTLYPLLRRLESQSLLQSRWIVEDGRPRRYYVVSELGAEISRHLFDEWHSLSRVLDSLFKTGGKRGVNRTVRA
jgi:DNA-binding PadR family transcriptional regulator